MGRGPVHAPALAVLAAILAGCAAGPDGGPRADVTMEGVRFAPANLTIQAGQGVTWANTGDAAHTVTSDEPGGPLDSGTMRPGDRFTHIFARPGTYAYHCEPHAYREADGTYRGMVGAIVVEAT